MLVWVLIIFCTSVHARNFNITHFSVPANVLLGRDEAVIECRYDANFTDLSWYKGANEFFRYKPGITPSIRTYAVKGIGSIEVEICGPTACILRLGLLTEDASGLYRCDIERKVPPYMFQTQAANMEIQGRVHRKPLVEGLASKFKHGDLMQAYCRATPGADIRWYLNGREVAEMKNSLSFKMKSYRYLFSGLPPTITIQCAELMYDKLSGSEGSVAYWKDNPPRNLSDKLTYPNKSEALVNNFKLTYILFISITTILVL